MSSPGPLINNGHGDALKIINNKKGLKDQAIIVETTERGLERYIKNR